MSVIWKFPVFIDDGAIRRDMPKGRKFLSLQVQGGGAQMWWLVDPDSERESVLFVIHGTGHSFNAARETYLGTWKEGQFVWHLFEKESRGPRW